MCEAHSYRGGEIRGVIYHNLNLSLVPVSRKVILFITCKQRWEEQPSFGGSGNGAQREMSITGLAHSSVCICAHIAKDLFNVYLWRCIIFKELQTARQECSLSLNIHIIASWRAFVKAPFLMSVEHHFLYWPLYTLILSKSTFYEETTISFNIEYKYSSITHRHLHRLYPPTPSSFSTLHLHLFPLLQLPISFFLSIFFEIIM